MKFNGNCFLHSKMMLVLFIYQNSCCWLLLRGVSGLAANYIFKIINGGDGGGSGNDWWFMHTVLSLDSLLATTLWFDCQWQTAEIITFTNMTVQWKCKWLHIELSHRLQFLQSMYLQTMCPDDIICVHINVSNWSSHFQGDKQQWNNGQLIHESIRNSIESEV